MKGIFIGRFQPFHNGHLSVCKEILKKTDKLVIAIGNPNNETNPSFVNEPDEELKKTIINLRSAEKNPWTLEQRKQMISKSLQEMGIHNFEIIPFYGYYTDGAGKLGEVVDKQNSIIFLPMKDPHQTELKSLCEKLGWKVEILQVNDDLSATKVRDMIKNNENVSNLVPKAVYEMIK